MDIAVYVDGTVVEIRGSDEVVVQGKDSLAVVMLHDNWYPEVKLGDRLEFEDGGCLIQDGAIISWPDASIIINGQEYRKKWK